MNTYIFKSIKMPFLIITAIIAFCISLFSCTDRIDIKTEDAPPRLVIYGYITSDTMQHSIRITRSSGYFATSKPAGISDATVTISTDDTTFILKENLSDPGLYQTDASAFGVEGKTYTLNVKVAFDGAKEEYEASSYLPLPAAVDSIFLKESENFTDFVEILLYGKMADNEENYMSFHAYRNNVLVNDSLVNFSLIDDEYIDKKEMKGIPCYYLDQEKDECKIQEGDTVGLQINSITKEYSDFLRDAQTEAMGSVPIFSGPPANIQTNIRPKNAANKIPISGFFTAYSRSRADTIYK